jgi:hypothetical protein
MRIARQVRRNVRESKARRARRLRLAWQQRFAQHLVNAIQGLTECARSGAELSAAIGAHVPFENLDAHLQARLDDARDTIDRMRDERLAEIGS